LDFYDKLLRGDHGVVSSSVLHQASGIDAQAVPRVAMLSRRACIVPLPVMKLFRVLDARVKKS
jgi:hypothetical protein